MLSTLLTRQLIESNLFTTNIILITAVCLTLWCTITVPAGYVAEAAIPLPAPTAELANNITSFINTTLNNHPELKTMLGPGRERIITFKKRPEASDLEKFGIELLNLPGMNMVAGMIPDVVVDELQKLGIVESVADSRSIQAWNATTKSITTQQGALSWALDRIDQKQLPLDGMYRFPSSAGQDVDIYVVDTGIDIKHKEFGGRAVWGGTFVAEPGVPDEDDAGHGTMVASVIGGNNLGVAKKANLIAVKILNSKGKGTTASTVRALSWIWNRYSTNTSPKGMTIVNMSVGSDYDKAINDIINKLVLYGIIVVAASGNGDQEGNGEDGCLFSPGSANGAISVGATSITDQVASFSNFGSCVTLFAPGVNVPVARPHSDEYVVVSGTSFAAPVVTGVIALAMSEAGPLPPYEVQKRLLNAATKNVISELKSRTANLLVNIDLDYDVYVGGANSSNRVDYSLIYTLYGVLVMASIWRSFIAVHL